MIFLAADLAIFERLTGAPLDSKGRPKVDSAGVPVNRNVIGPPKRGMLPSYGIVLPMAKHPNDQLNTLTTNDPDAVRLFEKGYDPAGFRQVPIFDENLEARQWADVWPCVTFRWRGHDFDESTFIYSDPFAPFNPRGVPVTVNGETQVKTRLVRPQPMGWKLEYTITAYAKSRMELGMICEQIQRLFPPRGALVMKQMDGTEITCDMLLQRTVNLDLQGADGALKSMGAQEQSYLARGYVFEIEAYDDNTANRFGSRDIYSTQVVTERVLELKTLQAASYRNAYILDTLAAILPAQGDESHGYIPVPRDQDHSGSQRSRVPSGTVHRHRWVSRTLREGSPQRARSRDGHPRRSGGVRRLDPHHVPEDVGRASRVLRERGRVLLPRASAR
jgi:hypothetical protein